jgi:hypothetical protein
MNLLSELGCQSAEVEYVDREAHFLEHRLC